MCGIVGVVDRRGRPASPTVLRAMVRQVAHRGPDDEGVVVDGPVGLAHRRLSIIDLSPAGHQPMATRSGDHVLIYGGEVYNFAELRAELEAEGARFRSRTDTEVVLEALARWGEAALGRFNGMFSLALHDRRRSQVLLARDRYGIKPLYVWERDDLVLFASEIKAFFAHPAFRVEVDVHALAEYLTFQNFLTDRTLFGGVRLLPPGSLLRIPTSGPTSAARWWSFDFCEPDDPAPHGEYVEELDRLVQQAVARQLVADVPVGAYLSGGMDTGALTAIASSQLPDLRTFTVGFDLSSASGLEVSFDERAKAEAMSALFRTEQYEMVLKAGDMERAMARLVWHLEEPRVGQSYPNYYAAKLAASFGPVVLSGSGGDEIFAGYPWRYYRAVVNSDFDDYLDKYYAFWQRLVPAETMPALLRPLGLADEDLDLRAAFRSVFPPHAGELTRPEDYINASLLFECKTFLHGLLVVEDKLSMAHGLETRVPLLDNDLVDFAMRVPVREKLGNLGEVVRINENEPGPKTRRYFEQTRDGKLLLRETMRRYVPEAVTSAPKQGFSAPDASWFRGESIEFVRRRLLAPNRPLFELLDRSTVHALVGDHLEGRANRRLLIWSLLCLDHWLELFADGSPSEPPRR